MKVTKYMRTFFLLIIALASITLFSGCCITHDWQDATCTEPKTCTKCGKTEGEALGHTWVDATCTEPRTCSVCGETEGKALGHTWVDATCTEPKTCSVCGETEGDPLGHDVEATCEGDVTCGICGKTLKALDHTWIDATCTEPKTCSVCGKTEGKALGHTTDNGTCERCGKKILKSVEYSGSGDSVLTDVSIPAGIYKVSLVNEGDHNFIVRAYSNNGSSVGLANEIGYYTGSTILTEDIDGGSIEIKSSGTWKITFEGIKEGGTSNLSGSGDWVSPYFNLTSGALPVTLTNDADHNFIVTIYNENGKRYSSLANEIGAYNGSTIFNKGDSTTKYFIVVQSSGNWTVDFGLDDKVTTSD